MVRGSDTCRHLSELAVSVATFAQSDTRACDAILESITIDAAAKPVTPTPARKASFGGWPT